MTTIKNTGLGMLVGIVMLLSACGDSGSSSGGSGGTNWYTGEKMNQQAEDGPGAWMVEGLGIAGLGLACLLVLVVGWQRYAVRKE